jgi:tetratricopeptide (TPR) repeat protein
MPRILLRALTTTLLSVVEFEKKEKESNLKPWISLLLLFSLASCSSLKNEKVIREGLSEDALAFYYSAEGYRLRGKYKEAINLYDRAGSLYISKLAYREYILTQLKKALIFISLHKLKPAGITLVKARYWQDSFALNVESEIKAVEAKLFIAKKENDLAYTTLKELITLQEDNLLLKTYYQALAVETGLEQEKTYLPQIKASFDELYEDYQKSGTQNPDALIYIGKTLVKQKSTSTTPLLRKLEHIGRELEIPALAIFILEQYKLKAKEDEKAFFQYLIDEVKSKENAAILI